MTMRTVLVGVWVTLLAGVALAQNPVAPTPPRGDNSNRIATTAFVNSAVGVASVSLKSSPCAAVGDGIADDTVAINACEAGRPVGSAMVWPPGTYKITGQVTATKAGSWDMQGATINVTSLPGPISPNGTGGLTVPISDFVINGGGSTLNFVPGANAAAVFFSGGKYSRLGTDPIFQAYTTGNSSLAAGAQTTTNSGTSTCASGTYTVSGGTGTPATLTGVAGAGVITSLTTLSPGNYTVFPPNPAPLTGTGCSGSPTATLTSATNIKVGDTSFVAGRAMDAATLNPNDWIVVFHLDPGSMPGTGTSNWIKSEIKQVVSVTGSTTINVSAPFGQQFSVGSAAAGCVDEQPAGASCWPNLWAKLLNPIQNVGLNGLTINATSVPGGTIAINSDIGVINGVYQNNTINVSGLSLEAFFNFNLQFLNNTITHEDTRASEIAVSTAGRVGGNTWYSQGTGNLYCIYLDDGVFGMRIDHNQCYGRVGGAVISYQDSFGISSDHNLVTCGAGSNSGLLLLGTSNSISDGDMIINCVEGVIFGADTLQNGKNSASGNLLVNTVVRNASADSVHVTDSTSSKNSIVGLNTDSSDGFANCGTLICDSGTGTIIFNNISGAWVTGPRLSVNGPDNSSILFIGGATKGLRIGADGTGSNIQGVANDNLSYQPLTIGGGAPTNFTGVLNLGFVSGAGASAKTVCVDASNNVLLKVGAC